MGHSLREEIGCRYGRDKDRTEEPIFIGLTPIPSKPVALLLSRP